jgi:3-methylfumaryl-CoA hydratase
MDDVYYPSTHPAASELQKLVSPPRLYRRSFSEELGARISLMLGLAQSPASRGHELPQGWHFALIDCETSSALLRPDGFPGLGTPLPDIALPRLLAGGRSITFHRPLLVCAPLVRTSVVGEVRHKDGPAGPMAIVKVSHEIREDRLEAGDTAISEEQTYILLQSAFDPGAVRHQPPPPGAKPITTVRPDQTMLFQFSALTFNSHKIHLDRHYARQAEGYPDLVVNGGLTTLLMTEIARGQLGLHIKRLAVRNSAPLFCDRDITFLVESGATTTRILAADDQGSIAAEMDIDHHEL